MEYLLGADIGTTRAKCLLFDEAGRLVASSYRDYPSFRPHPGWSEQRAEDWYLALAETSRDVLGHLPAGGRVRALSLATQGGTLVPLAGDLSPTHNAIVWNDSRCAEQGGEVARALGADYVYRKTGWSLGSALNMLEIMWLRQHRPEAYANTRWFLSVPDYLALRLTGRAVIDPSNAGINQLADIDRLCWDEPLLAQAGIREDQLARIAESGEVIGSLTRQAAQDLGLSTDTLLVTGGHDQYCAALGIGAVHDGDVFVATGTCWVVVGISGEPVMRHARSRHTAPGLWGSLISHEAGGGALEWFRQQLGPTPEVSYDELNAQVARVPAGSNGAVFYPYLSGASYPVRDDALRGALMGLGAHTTRFELARAVMEGVCFQVNWMSESFGSAARTGVKMVGGAVNSPVWTQIMADVAGVPVSAPDVPDVGCVGAAMLAGVGAGVYTDMDQAVRALCGRAREIAPGPDSAAYRRMYEQYKRGFERLRNG